MGLSRDLLCSPGVSSTGGFFDSIHSRNGFLWTKKHFRAYICIKTHKIAHSFFTFLTYNLLTEFVIMEIKKGDDTMSAVARDYSYQVKINKNKKKPEPTISKETLERYAADVAKYLTKEK